MITEPTPAEAPTIADATLSFASTRRARSCAIVIPSRSAIDEALHTGEDIVVQPAAHQPAMRALVARDPSGGASPGRYLPERAPCASGDQTIRDAVGRAERNHLALRLSPEQRVLRLRRDQLSRIPCSRLRSSVSSASAVRSIRCSRRSAPCRPATTSVSAAIVLGERGLRVVAMALVEVDAVGAQARERRLDLFQHLLA